MTDWDLIRAEFPALSSWTYLNTATFGQLPARATKAVAMHFAHRDALACSDFLDWYEQAREIRQIVGRLVGCTAEDIAFIPNASSGLALLLNGLDWAAGDEAVTLQDEFPNQLYALGYLERRGVRFVACTGDNLMESIGPRTRLVAISSVNYNTGYRPALREVSDHAKSKGALLLVDGTQSVGALQFHIPDLRPDMLIVHGYKWLISPTGVGFAYLSPALRTILSPSVIGWRSHRNWRSVNNLHHGVPEFDGTAEMFEGGGIAMPLILAMEAAMQMLLDIGMASIESRVLQLADNLTGRLRDVGAEVDLGTSQIVTARFPGLDPEDLAAALRAKNILVAARKGRLRISPHFYNNDGDIERFCEQLRPLIHQ